MLIDSVLFDMEAEYLMICRNVRDMNERLSQAFWYGIIVRLAGSPRKLRG